jgi:hypothetical protein
VQAGGYDEPIPFNRVGDAGCIGLEYAKTDEAHQPHEAYKFERPVGVVPLNARLAP